MVILLFQKRRIIMPNPINSAFPTATRNYQENLLSKMSQVEEQIEKYESDLQLNLKAQESYHSMLNQIYNFITSFWNLANEGENLKLEYRKIKTNLLIQRYELKNLTLEYNKSCD